MKTRSQEVASEVNALLRARNPLLWVVTREEARVERHLFEAAAAAGYVPRTWDTAAGVCRLDGSPDSMGAPDIDETLNTIRARSLAPNVDRGLWILRDAPIWLQDLPGAAPARKLRNLARSLPSVPRNQAQAIVVITSSAAIPPELAAHWKKAVAGQNGWRGGSGIRPLNQAEAREWAERHLSTSQVEEAFADQIQDA